ncbi:MAG: hypothetical protein WEB58_21260 [Planctomycetaceae bacterium]
MENGNGIRESWLKCKVFKGMFSDEYAVELQNSRGESFSVFVPREDVLGDPEHRDDGRLKVKVFRDGGATWAVLPTNYRDTIPVLETELCPA